MFGALLEFPDDIFLDTSHNDSNDDSNDNDDIA